MKLSAAIFAALISAAPACSADWATEVNADNLSAIAIPAPAAPSRSGPREGQNYSGAEELLIKEFGITEITMDIPESEVILQDRFYNNAFCFEHALRKALSAVLEKHDNPTSPLGRALSEIGALGAPTKSELKKARQKVINLLNSPSSLISLVRPYKQYQPQDGESVEQNWVFFLRLNGNYYWAIVDRADQKETYAYGLK